MKTIDLENDSYEDIKAKMEHNLGMKPGAFDRIQRVYNSVSALKRMQQEDEERDLDRAFSGKTRSERVALVKTHKNRIRKFLGLGRSATSTNSRDASASLSGRTVRRRLK